MISPSVFSDLIAAAYTFEPDDPNYLLCVTITKMPHCLSVTVQHMEDTSSSKPGTRVDKRMHELAYLELTDDAGAEEATRYLRQLHVDAAIKRVRHNSL